MSERRRFRPESIEGLEPRLVLSRGSLIAPVTVAKLKSTPRNNNNQEIVNQVNQAFDSFTTDYLQAQGAYLSINTDAAHTAFSHYVAQRVKLLSAQLTQIFVHVPGSLDRAPSATPGGPVVVQRFLRSYINGTAPTTLIVSLEGTRGGGTGAIPPVGTTGTTATLYTDQAISAIATARTISLNSVGFLVSHTFNKHK